MNLLFCSEALKGGVDPALGWKYGSVIKFKFSNKH